MVGVVMYTHNCQRSQWGKDKNQAKIKEDETGEFDFFTCILSDLHCTPLLATLSVVFEMFDMLIS